MTADRNLPNSSFNYIVAEKHGSGSLTSVSVSLNSSSTLPYLLSNNPETKAAVSLEQLFCPISSESGTTFPYIDSPDYNSNIDRFNYGFIPTVGSGVVPTQEDIVNKTSNGDKRSIGFALPMYAAGMGMNTFGDSVGHGSPTNNDITNYKAGPIDLRWDEERRVWTGGASVIKGYLSSDITAPTERNVPTEFTIQTYKSDGSGNIVENREVTLLNYDLHMSLNLQTKCVYSSGNCTFEDEDIFVVAMGNIPVYIGSTNE